MKTRTVIITLIVVIALALGAFAMGAVVAFVSHAAKGGRGLSIFGDAIAVVRVEGGIYESRDIIEEIEDFRKDSSVKAIVLRINSPGGSVAASQEIYHAVKRAAEEKPVIASMETVAASGGYYVALGATTIFANPGTVTGSIGARFDHVMLKELFNWAKIRYETLKSGRFKDIGAFDHPLSAEERVLLQDLLDDIHGQFKEAVAAERELTAAEVDVLADGRIFTGRAAHEAKLVDQLGGYLEAIDAAKELAGIKGEPKIVEKKRFRYEWLSETWESAADLFWSALAAKASRHGMRLPAYEAASF